LALLYRKQLIRNQKGVGLYKSTFFITDALPLQSDFGFLEVENIKASGMRSLLFLNLKPIIL
jgi:hypothetical protein